MLINKEVILSQLEKADHSFIILTGQEGSGKKTTAKALAQRLGRSYLSVGNKINDIREINDLAQSTNFDLLVCIEDGDNLTIQAQNALLKLAEEPPKNIRLILCSSDPSNLLATTRSRGISFSMPPVSLSNLTTYINQLPNCPEQEAKELILQVASTYKDVDELVLVDIKEFIAFTNKVLDNIGAATVVNALKISRSLAVTQNSVGYGVILFFRVVKYLLYKKTPTHPLKTLITTGIVITNTSINKIKKGASNLMVVDNWVIDIKNLLRQHNREGF